MKKKTKKLNVIMSLIIVFTLLLGCGALTYQKAVWVKNDIYEDIQGSAGYLQNNIEEYYVWGETDFRNKETHANTENALGIIPSFYLAHEDVSYVSSDVGFHSMLKNSKGETIAEYQPYIVFEKGINNIKKHDVRVLILGKEFTEKYWNLFDGDIYDKYGVLNALQSCYAYGKYNCDVSYNTIEVDGTCDDNFVYLNKLTWYERNSSNNATHGFIPEKNQTTKGKTDFEEWFDIDNYNPDTDYTHYISMQSVQSIDSWNTDYNKEAKKICEDGFGFLKKNPDDHYEIYGEGLFTSTVRRTDYITDYYDDGKETYVYSCAYVFHPLKMAVEALTPVYAVAAGIALFLIIFICVLIKKVFKEHEIICETGPENDFMISERDKDISGDEKKELNGIQKE